MSKIISSLILVAAAGTTAYFSGTVIKAEIAEKNLAQPIIGGENVGHMGKQSPEATTTATSTLE
jgi:hypothetical protein